MDWEIWARLGRPRPNAELKALIIRTSHENPLWGTERIRGELGNVLWYEQHMTRKSLEVLADELDKDSVRAVALLFGPTHVDDKARREFERFAEEMANIGIEAEWRAPPASMPRSSRSSQRF